MNDRVKFALQGACSVMQPAGIGMFIVIVMSLVAANPTWKSWVCWACIFVGIFLMGFVIHYLAWKKR